MTGTTYGRGTEPTSELLALASTGLPRPAIAYALELLDEGLAPERLIVDVLAGAQREVGRRWARNEWGVAQEHAATAVVDGVLGAVGLSTSRSSLPRRGSVVVACVEGEYHSLPARMGAERLRVDGWDVSFLGASVPTYDLQQYVVDEGPDRIVLSCTMTLGLRGAARCISALADLGAAAVAAGPGFGDTPDRAARLGASGWLGPYTDATALLESPLPAARSIPLDRPGSREVTSQQQQLVDTCSRRALASPRGTSSSSDRQLRSVRQYVDHLVSHLALAIDLDEPRLFHDFAQWFADYVACRELPPDLLADCLDTILRVVDRQELYEAAVLCRSVLQACDRRVTGSWALWDSNPQPRD